MDEPNLLRGHIGRILEDRADAIVGDAVAVFPFAGAGEVAAGDGARLAHALLRLLAGAAREGDPNPPGGMPADLRRIVSQHAISTRQLFGLVYLLERAALDELAIDESFGATSEPWPAVAQLVRRASFDVLAALSEGLSAELGTGALVDDLTTLHTRPVLLAALDKEIQRAERLSHPFALIVFDVDRLAEIGARRGYGFADRVLEAIGIVIHHYFREQDWVSRSGEDEFAVLLPETQRSHAEQLAEGVRATIEDRLAQRDYRSEEAVAVTVSVAVLIVESVTAGLRADQLMRDAEDAVERAKEAGRNRVESVTVGA